MKLSDKRLTAMALNTAAKVSDGEIISLIAEVRASRARLAKADRLAEAARGIYSLLESGWLCRDTTDDHKPDFAMRQIQPVQKLKAFSDAIDEWDAP